MHLRRIINNFFTRKRNKLKGISVNGHNCNAEQKSSSLRLCWHGHCRQAGCERLGNHGISFTMGLGRFHLKSIYVSLLPVKMRAEQKETAGNMWKILRGKRPGGKNLGLSNREMLIQYSFSLKEDIKTWNHNY